MKRQPATIAILLAACAAHAAAPVHTAQPGKAAPNRAPAMMPVRINLFPDAAMSGAPLGLDLRQTDDGVEQLTVYARRTPRRPAVTGDFAHPIVIGGITITHALDTTRPGLDVLTVTAAMPIAGIRGLDAVANIEAAEQTDDLAAPLVPIHHAGPPLGIRISF